MTDSLEMVLTFSGVARQPEIAMATYGVVGPMSTSCSVDHSSVVLGVVENV